MRINAFRVRLFVLTSVLILVPVLVFSIVLFTSTQNTLKENASHNIQETLESNFKNIESKLAVMESASTSLLIALAKLPKIVDPTLEVTGAQLFEVAQYPVTVHSSLIVDTYSIGGFNHFYLYLPSRSMLLVSKMTFFEGINPNVLDCHFIPRDKWGVSTPYENVICNPTVGATIKEKNISKNFYMLDNEDNEIILTTNVKEQYISQLLISGLQIKPTYAVIMDRHGNLISSMNEEEIGKSLPQYRNILAALDGQESGNTELAINGKTYLLNWTYSQGNEWYYIIATDAALVVEGITPIFNMLPIISLCLLVLSFGITLLLTYSTVHPLRELSRAMTEIKNGNYNVKLTEKPNAEFQSIYAGFNEMAAEISTLMRNVSEEHNRKIIATIQMLQTEINPHMLYNSLESIYSIAKINQQEEIANLVMALSRFFRIALSGGKHLVPFREAFELAKQYVTVQNIRLNYKILFTYDIPENIYDLNVPKFLLQPVIENCIIHGFQNKRGEWHINLSVNEEGDWVVLTVRDNGIGIHDSTLARLNKRVENFNFEDSAMGKGYALRNLNYQIKLKFGEESGIRLNSVYGEYTEVVIRLNLAGRKTTRG